MGVVVRRYIDFLVLLIPTPLVSVLFCSSIPTFCSFFMFLSIGMSEILLKRNTLQTLEYLALGTLSRILNTTMADF